MPEADESGSWEAHRINVLKTQTRHDDELRAISRIEQKLAIIETKVALYAAVISAAVAIAVALVEKLVLK